MPDEPTESGQEPQEAQGTPSPDVPSVASADKQSSAGTGGEGALQEVLTRLEKIETRFEELPNLVERNVQSTKDRRFQVLEGIDPDTLKQFKSYLDRFNGNEEQAIREMQIDSLLQRGSAPGDSGKSQEPVTGRMVEFARRVLDAADIAYDDPEYVELVNRPVASEGDFYQRLNDFVGRRQSKESKQSAVTSATAVNQGGSSAGVSNDIEAVSAELQEYQSGEHGSLTDPNVQTKMRELSAKHKELLKEQGVTRAR